MKLVLRPFLYSVILLLPGLLVGQVNADWKTEHDRLYQEARREGGLRVFVSGYQDFARAFQKFYPDLRFSSVTGTGSELSQKFLAERRAGRTNVDVYMGGTTSPAMTLLPAKALAPLKPLLANPEVVDSSKWWGGRLHWIDEEGQHILLYGGTPGGSGIAINTKLVKKEEIKSYSDLLNPKWRAKIMVNDPRRPGIGSAGLRFIYNNPELGPKFLYRLFREMEPFISTDLRTMQDYLAKGVYPLLIFPGGITDLRDELKQPVDTLPVMKEGSHISTDFATIAFLDRAPHPNAAKLFINWVLSREGQKVYQEILWDNGKGRALNSLRLDVSKDHLPQEERLKEGIPYKIYDSPKTINLKPAYEVINKALADAGRK